MGVICAPAGCVHIAENLHRPILLICPHIEDADKAADDLQTFGCKEVEPMAAWEGEEELADATDETRAERLKLVVSCLVARPSGQWSFGLVIPASVQAFVSRYQSHSSAGKLSSAGNK